MYRPIGAVGAGRFIFLKRWSEDEMQIGNRSKASRINKVAEKLRPKGLTYFPGPQSPPRTGSGLINV